mgnify:FL=1
MKTKYYIFALAAMTMTLGSCSDSENTTGTEAPKSITVSTSIGKMTRITTDEKGAQAFSEGDEISVYAWTGSADKVPAAAERVVNNAINKLTDKGWVATPQMLWKNNLDKHYFIGIYPTKNVDNLTADTYTFNAENQLASDLLVAVNVKGLSYTKDAKDAVKLDFTHVMAKMVVNLTYKNQWGGIPTVKNVVVSDAVKEATINYLTKAVTPTATAKADFEVPATAANTQYVSVLIPQNGIQKIAITIGEKTFIYDHKSPFNFESGKITTINLEVGRDQVILDEVKISDWAEGSTFNGEAFD